VAFADWFAGRRDRDVAWDRRWGWAAISSAEAPTGDPCEFLPFCAIQAFGAIYLDADPQRQAAIEWTVGAAASDPRWRMRTAVAIELQRVGERGFGTPWSIVERWRTEARLTEQ
jgi:hypothetical protein